MKLKRHSTEQKLRGAYYTPKDLAVKMVRLSCSETVTAVLEPSCGDGVFIEALGECGFLRDGMSFDAVEVDGGALSKTREVPVSGAKANYIHRDFFEFYEDASPFAYDLVLGNPPYIRYQYLESSQRFLLADILHRHGMKANKLVNAWVGFMVACTDLLADGGTLAFVVPAEILQVAYADDLRKFLAREYDRVTLIAFKSLVFDDIEQETVVFIGRKGASDGVVRVVEVDNVDDINERDFAEVGYQRFSRDNGKWTRYFVNAEDSKTLGLLAKDERLVPMSKLAIVNVGVTTGNNAYFSLTDDISHDYGLDEFTLPLIGRSSHASGVFFTEEDWERNRALGKRARLLVLEPNQYDHLGKQQKKYIDLGVERGENQGYKCSIRDSWYSVPSVWIPDAFFLRRSNLYPKFVLNRCGAISTDTMHRIKFKSGIDPKLALIAYYNSIAFAFTELCGRSYGGGVLEILPKEVGRVMVLDPEFLHLENVVRDDIIALVDNTVREESDIECVLDYVDNAVLVDRLGFSEATCVACRRIWKTLQSRRLSRSSR